MYLILGLILLALLVYGIEKRLAKLYARITELDQQSIRTEKIYLSWKEGIQAKIDCLSAGGHFYGDKIPMERATGFPPKFNLTSVGYRQVCPDCGHKKFVYNAKLLAESQKGDGMTRTAGAEKKEGE